MNSEKKKIANIILFFISVLFFSSCEQTLTETDFPYEEVLVIRGELIAGDTLNSLFVGRTLPFEEKIYSYWDPALGKYVGPESEAWVKDAIVTVSTDTKVFLLTYSQYGLYKNYSLVIETGKVYRLHVEWKGKVANAITTVPETPMLDSVIVYTKVRKDTLYGINFIEYTYTGYCRAKSNTVYYFSAGVEETAFYINQQSDTVIYTNVNSPAVAVVKRIQTNISIPDIIVNKPMFQSGSYSSNEHLINKQCVSTLTSYDESYYKYYDTYSLSDNDFSIDPRPIAWNVTGEAIGMFIGASQSVTKKFQIK